MRSIESTGKTLDLAISSGLENLGVTVDQVDVEIIQDAGFLKKAKVKLTVIEDSESKNETKTEKKEVKVEKESKVEESKKEEVKVEEKKVEEKKYTSKDIIMYVQKYLSDLIYFYNQVGEVAVEEVDGDFKASMKGDDLSAFIGYHGEVLEAFQVILNATLQNKFNFKNRIFLDVQGYKSRREKTLQDLAKRMAKVVVKNKKSYALEPMNSYERRIIHTTLQGFKNISTHSEGEGKDRHLIIDYVE